MRQTQTAVQKTTVTFILILSTSGTGSYHYFPLLPLAFLTLAVFSKCSTFTKTNRKVTWCHQHAQDSAALSWRQPEWQKSLMVPWETLLNSIKYNLRRIKLLSLSINIQNGLRSVRAMKAAWAAEQLTFSLLDNLSPSEGSCRLGSPQEFWGEPAPALPGKVLALAEKRRWREDVSPAYHLVSLAQSGHWRSLPFVDRKHNRSWKKKR